MHQTILKDVNQALYVPFDTKSHPRTERFQKIDMNMQRPGIKANLVSGPTNRIVAQPTKFQRSQVQTPQMKMSMTNPFGSSENGATKYSQMKDLSNMMKPAPTAQFQPRMAMGGQVPRMGFQSVQQSNLYGASQATLANRNKRAPISAGTSKFSRSSTKLMAQAASADPEPVMVASMEKRILMNYLLLGAAALPTGLMGGAFISFFIPRTKGGGSSGTEARDRYGDVVKLTGWMQNHKEGSRALVQGLKGDATYLVSTENGVKDFGINAVCTHLGCVVPWNAAENKFMCPCHGSQYDPNGKVVRGPAPLSLAISHVTIKDNDDIVFTPWTEEDFRTGQAPWWK